MSAIKPENIPVELKQLKCKLAIASYTYDPATGKVYYKERIFENPTARQKQWNTRFSGKEAGYFNGEYWKASVGGHSMYIHQIAFAIMTGKIPDEVDHKDKNKENNAWDNLRIADHSSNTSNCFKRHTNKSGYKGVSWSKSNNCWRMDITSKGNKYHSYHKSPEEAHAAYISKSKELHRDFGSYE